MPLQTCLSVYPFVRTAAVLSRKILKRGLAMNEIRKKKSADWKRNKEKHKIKIGKKCRDCGKLICPKSRFCYSCLHKGERNNNWKNGVKHHTRGYIQIKTPEHPFSDKNGYVLEHRLVMEAHIGRTLLPMEVVHHINGIAGDNRIENLMLFSDSRPHSRLHAIRQGLGKRRK